MMTASGDGDPAAKPVDDALPPSTSLCIVAEYEALTDLVAKAVLLCREGLYTPTSSSGAGPVTTAPYTASKPSRRRRPGAARHQGRLHGGATGPGQSHRRSRPPVLARPHPTHAGLRFSRLVDEGVYLASMSTMYRCCGPAASSASAGAGPPTRPGRATSSWPGANVV